MDLLISGMSPSITCRLLARMNCKRQQHRRRSPKNFCVVKQTNAIYLAHLICKSSEFLIPGHRGSNHKQCCPDSRPDLSQLMVSCVQAVHWHHQLFIRACTSLPSDRMSQLPKSKLFEHSIESVSDLCYLQCRHSGICGWRGAAAF